MSGENIKIAIQRLHVTIGMHNALRAVNRNRNTLRMRGGDDFPYWVDHAQYIGNLRDRNQFHAVG